MGINDEGHPCGFCFVMYSPYYKVIRPTSRPEMLFNSSQKQSSTIESSGLIGTRATKKEEKREGELEVNKGERTSGVKKTLKGPGKNQPFTKTGKEATGTTGTIEATGQTGEIVLKGLSGKGPDRETMGIATEITEGSGSKKSLEVRSRGSDSSSSRTNTDDWLKM